MSIICCSYVHLLKQDCSCAYKQLSYIDTIKKWNEIYRAVLFLNDCSLNKTLYYFFSHLGTIVTEKLHDVVTKTILVKDIKKMSSGEQTSSLESFHAVINQFAPQMRSYKYHGMLSRKSKLIENNYSLI